MDNINQNNSEKEIDLLELGSKLWERRKFILKFLILGLILGIVIAFSIPKQYTTTVTLTPESQSAGTSSNMNALAAVAGINLSNNSSNANLSPEIYPTLMESTPFIAGLFDIPVRDSKSNIDTTLYYYIANDQKQAWWSYILGLPSKILGVFSSNTSSNNLDIDKEENDIILGKNDMAVINSLKEKLSIKVDKKTGIISLSSTMQSPQISAYVADTVTSYLQSYVIKYRTQKARQDLIFSEKLYDEAKKDYYNKQQQYAKFVDENLGVVSAAFATTRDRLQNEMNLAYSVYNQTAQQLQVARIKVQDTTPVYTIIQPAVEPLFPSSPNKKLIVIGFVFLFGIIACGWVLGKHLIK